MWRRALGREGGTPEIWRGKEVPALWTPLAGLLDTRRSLQGTTVVACSSRDVVHACAYGRPWHVGSLLCPKILGPSGAL